MCQIKLICSDIGINWRIGTSVSSICITMLAVVTCDTRISEASWVLVWYSFGAPFWSIWTQFHPYSCCSDYRPEVPCLQTSTCMTFSKWWVLPGFCISTIVGGHKTLIKLHILLPIIIYIRWFYWHSWTEYWGYLWTGVAYSDWSYITGGLGTLDTFCGSIPLWCW